MLKENIVSSSFKHNIVDGKIVGVTIINTGNGYDPGNPPKPLTPEALFDFGRAIRPPDEKATPASPRAEPSDARF